MEAWWQASLLKHTPREQHLLGAHQESRLPADQGLRTIQLWADYLKNYVILLKDQNRLGL